MSHHRLVTGIFLAVVHVLTLYMAKFYLMTSSVDSFSFKRVLFYSFFFFLDRVSLFSPGCPGTHFVVQAELELRNLPASLPPERWD